MKRNRRNFTLSNFYCSDCGSTITLPRQKGSQREKNHIKDIYCHHCKKTTKHIEQRQFDFDFNYNLALSRLQDNQVLVNNI